MWRRFSSCESGAAKLRQVHHKIGLLAVAVLWLSVIDLSARDDWTVLENCQLIVNPANDGDSFHVSAGANKYIFRLYLVDAQETDEMIPRRLVEQAKYLGISVPQAIEVGRAAKEFTREKLSEPFAVFTHMSDAMGQSRLERFYAFVQTKDGDLGEQLVRNGLARIYGYKAAPPWLRKFTSGNGKASAIREPSEAGENWSVGRQHRPIEHARSKSVFLYFFPPRPKAVNS
jgi:endonuclease YncB( thermonuclease family)